MKKLTVDHAIKNKFTGIDCVKYFNPNWTDKDCDYHLWEETCYPFSTTIMIAQLNNSFISGKSTLT